MSKKRIVWHLEVPEHLNRQLIDYVKEGGFKTKSEFIRTAVRDRLEQEKQKMVNRQISKSA